MKKSFKKSMAVFMTAVIMLSCWVWVAPEEAEASEYGVGDIVEFGSYPQSEVTDNTTLSALNGLAPAWENWTSYGYYTGKCKDLYYPENYYGTMVQGDWMRYTDVTYNNTKYRGVKFTQYRPGSTISVTGAEHSYQDDNGYFTNTVYWFKYEPLKWKVLDPSTGFVVSENVIDAQAYNSVVYSNSNGSTCYNSSSHAHYANDYETSSIRKWLNADFYNTAFNGDEQGHINTTTISNKSYYTLKGNSILGKKYDSNDTTDNVFLLAYNEVLNEKYGFSSDANANDYARMASSTDYAKCQGVQIHKESPYEGNSYLLLRTPGDTSRSYAYVHVYCHITNHVHSYSIDRGVRPAMYVDESVIAKPEYKIAGKIFNKNIDHFTTTNSSEYNPELANMTAALSKAAYSESELIEAYTSLGFDFEDSDELLYDYSGVSDPMTSGCAIAFKKSDHANEYICLVSVRGSIGSMANLDPDWKGNFTIITNVEGKHVGFSSPADRIYENIKKLGEEKNISGNIKYVLTGHSRGAAVANLLAVKLMENGVSSANVYDYNFACPDVACKLYFAKYNNIFNVCNRLDIVPHVPGKIASQFTSPGTSWGKFGETYWFSKYNEDRSAAVPEHEMSLYLNFMDQKQLPTEWEKTYEDEVFDTTQEILGWLTKIFCPVDVVVTDTEGNNIASVINGEVNYYNSIFGDVIILTDGDKKVIYVNGDRDFNVNLIGTDEGSMTYSVEKTNLVSGEVSESKVFTDVTLKKDKKMFSPVSEASLTENIELFVVQNDGKKEVNSYLIETDGTEKEINHIYQTTVVEPTCTEKGYTIHTCINCEDTYNDTFVDYKGHSYSETKMVSTCKETGTVTYTCSCGDTYTEEIEINPDSHIGETAVRNVVNSTCTGNGYTGDTYCLDCGEKIAEGKVTDINGHKDADGNNSCDVCGATIKECSHICHKTGFMGFIWKILRIFFKLFGSQPVCSCGVAHY